jgi:centrosomal protein POC5
MIDQDVEDFTIRLDSLVSTFRNESVKEFLAMKRAVLHDQLTTIDTEKKRCNALLCAKQDEIEHLKEKLQTSLATCEHYDKQRNSLAVTTGLLRTKLTCAKLTSTTFKAWREFLGQRQTEHKLTRVAGIQRAKALKTKVFKGFRQFWEPLHRAKEAERVEKMVQDERSQLAMYYNKEMELLQARLEETTAALNRELSAKVDMQEGLKKAFMRGVCALNFEAMNVLNPQQLQYVDISAFDIGATGLPDLTSLEATQVSSPVEEEVLEDIQNLIPAESKDSKWKPAPVVGVRPRTAPVKDLYSAEECRLPCNLGAQPASGGKTIVFNRELEPKVKGKMPIKKGEVRKTSKK